jgi:PD-(D/E)XK endonuclease
MCFALRAIEEGLRPARPWGEPSGYDSLVHHKSTRIFRVQVKSTIYKMGRCYHCTIRTGNHPYKKDAFDFVAAYVIPEDVWYILPEKAVRGMSTVGLYPAMGGSKYDAYKEAWHLLRGETPGKIDCIQACAEDAQESPLLAKDARYGAPGRFLSALLRLARQRAWGRGGRSCNVSAAVGAELVG